MVDDMSKDLNSVWCDLDKDRFFLSVSDGVVGADAVWAIPPDVAVGMAARWTDGVWEMVPDYRNKVVYSNGELILWRDVGVLPSGVQAEMPSAVALAKAQSEKLAELNAAADAFVTAAAQTDKVPGFELQSWTLQAAEVKAWAADKTVATPLLDRIAASRGVDAEKLKAAALRKTLAYEQLTAHVAGQRQALQVRIEQAKDAAAVAALPIAFTLPEA